MAELVRKSGEESEVYFFEKLTSPKLSEALAREVGAGTLVLNDAAGLSEEDVKSVRLYNSVRKRKPEKALGIKWERNYQGENISFGYGG